MVISKLQSPLSLRAKKNSSVEENGQSDVKKKSIKSEITRKSISNYFVEFCDSTSIHGFTFLAESKRCALERLWWLTILCICFYICGSLVMETLQKWERNPIFISFSKEPLHIRDVPFPAVTVCPENKIKKSKYNYTDSFFADQYNELTKTESQKFEDISLMCKDNSYIYRKRSPPPQSDHDTIFENIIENAPSREDIFYNLETNILNYINPINISSFSPIFTDFGLCYSFNMLDRSALFSDDIYFPENHVKHQNVSHWSIDDNYEETTEASVPLRVSSVMRFITLYLKTSQSDIDEECDSQIGFKIILHHPAETPTYSTKFMSLANNNSYQIQIGVDAIFTPSELKSYDPLQRMCYFSQERQLKFFKTYTERNCRLECVTNYTLQECGCVLHYMPHENTTRICRLSELSLTFWASVKLVNSETLNFTSPEKAKLFCGCLPSCTSIVYQAEFQKENPQLKNYHLTQDGVTEYVRLQLSFKELSFITKERNELFSSTDFWASCGGILGLFTGFSVISLAEIIYFCSLRWICNLFTLNWRKDRK